MAVIGTVRALAGYLVGLIFKVPTCHERNGATALSRIDDKIRRCQGKGIKSITVSNQLSIEQLPRKRMIELLIMLGFPVVVHWLILALQIPILTEMPYWFFYLHEQAVQWQWIGFAISMLALATILVFSSANDWIKLSLLIVCGSLIQISLGLSLGKGLAGISDKMIQTGHAEFALVAIRQESMWNIARNYEALVDSGELGIYTPSKPPGSLLFYMAAARLANRQQKDLDSTQRLENLKNFASLVWPLISYLVLVPMWTLGRSFLGRRCAYIACLFYLCIPSVNLINLHLDQVLYPFLTVIPVAIILRACIRRNIPLAFVGGIALYAALYFSFALLSIAVMMTAILALLFYKNPARNWQIVLWLIGAMATGIAVFDLILRLWLHYDVLMRYFNASTYHVNWKGWESGFMNLLGAGVTDVLEFSVWLGIPLSMLFLGVIRSHLRSGKRVNLYSVLTASVFAIFLILILFGHTKAETARLWMFLIPYICLLVAGFVQRRSFLRGKWQIIFPLLVVASEFITTYLTLRHQDFR